jgi:hypothetical protein
MNGKQAPNLILYGCLLCVLPRSPAYGVAFLASANLRATAASTHGKELQLV